MLAALRSLFTPKPPEAARDTYIALVAQARNPFFFTTLGVPDTLDGRFEMIVLHLFLLEHRLVAEQEFSGRNSDFGEASTAVAGAARPPTSESLSNKQFAQFVSEVFFSDMDRSLREIGVSDTGVSHRIKKMGKAYHGRLQAYAAGLQSREAMRGALARNLYGTVEQGDVALLDAMGDYITRMQQALTATDEATLLNGQFVWPAV